MDMPGGAPVPESVSNTLASSEESEKAASPSEQVQQHLMGSGSSSSAPTSHTNTLGLKGMSQLVTPTALAHSVAEQFGFSGASSEEQQQQQKTQAKQERRAQLALQTFQAWKQRRDAEAESLRTHNRQKKQQILSLNTPLPKETVVHTRSEADKSETTLLDYAMRDALEARERKAQQRMNTAPKGQQKGPSLEGGEKQAKSDMFDRMTTGQEKKPKSTSSIADHELPLGE